MTYVDDPDLGMTQITVGARDVLTLRLDGVTSFAARCPEQYAALIECAAFVNWRRLELGERAILPWRSGWMIRAPRHNAPRWITPDSAPLGEAHRLAAPRGGHRGV